MKRKILGLDVGNSTIRAVIVERQLKGFSVLKDFVINLDELEPDDLELKDNARKDSPDDTAETTAVAPPFKKGISELLESINPDEISEVSICIPSPAVSFRNITLPFRSPKKIRQVLEFELAPNLPLADTTYVSDFTFQNRANGGDGASLLTASIPDAALAAYFIPLKAMGLKPSLITIQGYIAADHLLPRLSREKEDMLWIDLSEDHTTVCLSSGQRIVQLRSFGQALCHGALIRAIRQATEGENQRSGGKFSPEKCIITSHGEASKVLSQSLEEALHCPVEYAEISEHPNALAAAVAQATSRPVLNFCRGKYAEDSIFKRHAANISVLLIFVVMAFFSFIFKLTQDIHDLEKRVTLLDSASVELFKRNFPQKDRIVDPLMQMKIELEQLKESSGLEEMGASSPLMHQQDCIEILAELSNRILPAIDVEITRFILNPGRILLSGSTANFNDIDRIKGLLEESEMFKQVEIQSAAADKTGNRVRFKFIITQ